MLINFDLNNSKNSSIAYKSRIPKGVFYDAKDIPRLRCAKCGNFMMSKGEEHILMYGTPCLSNDEIINSVPKEIKRKAPYGFNFVKELLSEKGIGYLKKMYYDNKNNRITGQTTKQSKQIKQVLKKVLLITNTEPEPILPTKKIIKNLEKIKTEYPAETEEFVEILSSYTKKYPEKSLTDILTDKKLYDYHEGLKESQAKEYNNLSKKHFSNIVKSVKTLPADKLEILDNLNKNAYEIARKKSISDVLRNALIKNVYSKFLSSISDKDTKHILKQQINVIPLAHASGDYIFCKVAKIKNINDEKIIKFINNPLKNTFEHVNLKSRGGANDVSNGIYMCSHCNHERGSLPYPLLMKIFPDFIKNTQYQVTRLGTFIKKGTLIGYDTYPQDIKRTIKKVSGKDIKIDSFLKEQKKIIDARIKENSTVINKEEILIAQKEKESNKLKEQIEILTKARKEYLRKIKEETNDLKIRKRQLLTDIETLKNIDK